MGRIRVGLPAPSAPRFFHRRPGIEPKDSFFRLGTLFRNGTALSAGWRSSGPVDRLEPGDPVPSPGADRRRRYARTAGTTRFKSDTSSAATRCLDHWSASSPSAQRRLLYRLSRFSMGGHQLCVHVVSRDTGSHWYFGRQEGCGTHREHRLAHFLSAGRRSLVFCQRSPSTNSFPYICNHHFRINPGPLAARCELSFRSNVPLFRDLSRGCLGRRRGCSQEPASPGDLAVARGSPFNSILHAIANPIFRILAGGERRRTDGGFDPEGL